ncbi:Gfo/Idh/MocA family oxidoreductase [Paenibacillus sp. CGMCC 1.16610]|uniref:Gfo/Idh/MocA family oxidoreductase n=1 Tax=Paenibacillus anseongense TaxID=2682845 RepID=A0ABW9UDY6_9BACL|nr:MULTISPECIES: Gfo/Idh/MocA family oxidoreductase [Paenibacillus]MBA2943772.1 Gfo/Idh/MocA family oxidoreductase [Paenibacillus sp. CGMCC 1.16610]MVQ37661.1 gfo/Idh/MocA family oxidoreductase [Paenibacillus anseongense]
MLKIGLIGLGFMGRTHLENYIRLEAEGVPIKVVALCDIDIEKLEGNASGGNIDTGSSGIDFSVYNKYTSVADMLEKEQLDCVDMTLPTFLHREISIQCLNKGLHVLCEKPMALNAEECKDMIEAAEQNGKQLMIGQCLRFWPAYEYLKQAVANETYGKVLAGYFYRGGGTPTWGPWLLQNAKSGGALLDMHVHDIDMINWLFGKPESVSTLARNVVPGSGYDVVSTNYLYEDGKVINAQADWTLQGDYGFDMQFRVNFEKGNIIFNAEGLKVNLNDGPGFKPEISAEMGYYQELKYFVETLISGQNVATATPFSTMDSIVIAEAEIESADNRGAWVRVK